MLDQYNKSKNPFKVPENYFEDFNVDIMSKLPDKKDKKIVPLWQKVVPWAAIAAVAVGVLFMVDVSQTDTTNNLVVQEKSTEAVPTSTITATTITEDDYYAFLEEEVNSSYYIDMFSGDEF